MEKMNEQMEKWKNSLKIGKLRWMNLLQICQRHKNDNHKQADNLKAKYHAAESKLEEAKKAEMKSGRFKERRRTCLKDAEKHSAE